MVGGKVVEVIPCVIAREDGVREPRVWINCRGTGSERNNQCAVFVEDTPAARSVSEGDGLWWQGQHAFWTPRTRAFTDYQLRRIGCSGVARPMVTVNGL